MKTDIKWGVRCFIILIADILQAGYVLFYFQDVIKREKRDGDAADFFVLKCMWDYIDNDKSNTEPTISGILHQIGCMMPSL